MLLTAEDAHKHSREEALAHGREHFPHTNFWFDSLHRKLQCQPLKDFKVKFWLRLGKIPAQKTAMPTPEGLRNFGGRQRQPIFLFWYTKTGFELEED